MEHRVFLDTNILLSFFEISDEDLTKLSDAFALVDHNELVFVTTDRVESEFFRRRSGVIEASIKKLEDIRLPQAPVMARSLDENQLYEDARKQLVPLHKALLARLRADAIGNGLRADQLIKKFFSHAERIEITPKIITDAQVRVDCGDPPGKKGSLGDAINWEALLSLPSSRSVSIVSGDRDYRDQLQKQKLNEFLSDEWLGDHEGPIDYFGSLSDCVASLFPDLQIPSFEEVDSKIEILANSPNFYATHAAIADLTTVTSFTSKQASDLVEILNANSQVGWIIADPDVHDFYTRIHAECGSKISVSKLSYLNKMLEYDGASEWPILIPS